MSIARSSRNRSYRPKTSTRYSAQTIGGQRQRRELKPEKCKFLKPKSPKSSKGSKSSDDDDDDDRIRRRRRVATVSKVSIGVPNSEFVQQEVTKVYYDAQVKLKDPPPPPPVLNSAPSKGKGKAPKGFEWDYGEANGKPNPDYDYVLCEYPSYQPSVSPSPSQVPSISPTALPSVAPSMNPSQGPTLSHAPSVSMMPSQSAVPSQTPTMTFSPGCDIPLNEVYNEAGFTDVIAPGPTSLPNVQGGIYEYQLVYQVNADANEILMDLDEVLNEKLRDLLIWCGKKSGRRLLASSDNIRELMEQQNDEFIIDSISMNGVDTEATNRKCSAKTTVPQGHTCKVFQGDYTLYVRNDRTFSNEAIWTHVNNIIMELMNNGLELTNVYDIIFGGAEAIGEEEGPITLAAGQRGDQPAADQKVSPLGGTIMGLGVLVTLLFLFAATRKREHYNMERVEQIYDDDESLFDKSIGQGTDVMSNGSRARVLGDDDDSAFLDSDDIVADIQMAERHRLYGMGLRGSRLGPQENDLGGSGEAINVHNCTSATCPICSSKKRPIFVNTDLSAEGTEMYTPTYSDTVNMDMANRRYMSPDTIEM